MRILLSFIASSICFGLWSQCPQLWSRVKVAEGSAYTVNHKQFVVQIEVLQGERGTCNALGDSIHYMVYNSCGDSRQFTATRITPATTAGLSEFCIPLNQMGFNKLQTFTYTDTFRLDSGSTCPNLLVYYESPSIGYHNFHSVPVSSWVLLNTYVRNKPVQLDTSFRLLEVCNQNKRYYSPVSGDPDGDSLRIRMVDATHYTPSSGSFPQRIEKGLKFPFTDNIPIGASDFTIDGQTLSFTPFDTGFYGLPLTITEYKATNHPLVGTIKAATSYFQIPVLISDNCLPDLYFFEVFPEDTLTTFCGSGVITVPLTTPVLTSSINPDGTDFKFSNVNGYPAIVNKVIIPNTLFTNELKIDVSFFFDGVYRLAIVRGTDQNKVFNQCGYELQESDYFHLKLYNCPNEVHFNLAEEENGTPIYPNPFTDKIVVELNGEFKEVKLYTAHGALVPVEVELEKSVLTLYPQVPAGTYFIDILWQDGTRSTAPVHRF